MRKLYFAIYAVFLVLFGLVGYLAHQFANFPGDAAISGWLGGFDSAFFAWLMEAVSWLGDNPQTVVTVLGLVLVLLYFKRRLEAVFVVSVTALAGLINWLLKALVDRSRPGSELLDSGGLSFPSGHVTYAVVLFGFLFYLAPRLFQRPAVAWRVQAILIMLILLTAASRVYLGAHRASDVLGSFLLGGLLLVPAVVFFHNRLKIRDRNA